MKIGLFADAHYSSQEITCGKRYNSLSLEKIRQAYRFFAEKDCDLIVCLGDLIDREDDRETQEAQLGVRLVDRVFRAREVFREDGVFADLHRGSFRQKTVFTIFAAGRGRL